MYNNYTTQLTRAKAALCKASSTQLFQFLKKRNFALLFLAAAILTASCKKDPKDPPPTFNTESGTYLGITGFNINLFLKDAILLNNSTKSDLISFTDNLTQGDGTALYYAVDNTIQKINSYSMPSDLSNVSIITFTDGLDEGSMGKEGSREKYGSLTGYLTALSNAIKTGINKGELNAYSIGLYDKDKVGDRDAFDNNLLCLSSSPNNKTFSEDMNVVVAKFDSIAQSLYKENNSLTLALRLPFRDDGIKVRLTFNKIAEKDGIAAAASNVYIDGILHWESFEVSEYKGISSSSGKNIPAYVENGFLYVKLVDLKTNSGNPIIVENIKEWYPQPNGTLSQGVEFTPTGNTETTVDKKSACIMLVLDCSSSLSSSQFAELKQAAKNFIETITSENTGGGGDNPKPPTGSLVHVTNITSTSATFLGNITFAGVPTYTEKGFYYIKSDVYEYDTVNVSGGGIGNYQITVNNLEPNTLYRVQAYCVYEGKRVNFGNGMHNFYTEPEATTTAQVRFYKERGYINLLAMAVEDYYNIYAQYEYGANGYGQTSYYEIPSGNLIPTYLYAQDYEWYWAFDDYQYYFQPGYKYTFGVGDDGQYLVFYIDNDGSFTSSDPGGERQEVMRVPKSAIKNYEKAKATVE